MVKSGPSMTVKRFEALLDAFGPDMNQWPTQERALAEQLLSDSPEALQALQFSKALAGFLKAPDIPKAPAGLVDRIMQKAKK